MGTLASDCSSVKTALEKEEMSREDGTLGFRTAVPWLTGASQAAWPMHKFNPFACQSRCPKEGSQSVWEP